MNCTEKGGGRYLGRGWGGGGRHNFLSVIIDIHIHIIVNYMV